MGKPYRSQFSFFVSLLLLLQLVLPGVSAFAAEINSSILPPSNLASQFVTPDDVKLSWSSVYGATGYQIYEIGEGQLKPLAKSTTTSYTASNLAEGSYTYVVSTLSAEGESGPSAPINVEVVYPEMAAPATLTYTIQNGNDIVLSWGSSANAQTYNVYSMAADGSASLLTSTANRTFSIANNQAGTYTYAVSAVNSLYGESQRGTPLQVTVVTPVMAAPTGPSYTLSNGSDVTLRWNAVTYAGSYKVYQIIDGQPVLQKTVTTTSAAFTALPAGDYTYEIRSYSDRFGESAEAAKLAFTVSSITLLPPTNAAARIQNVNDITLSWTAAANATGYKVYQIVDGQPVLKGTVTGTAVTYTNQPAGDYTYEIRSTSTRYGDSADAASVSITVGSVTMSAPGGLTAKLQNVNDIVLAWTSAANATGYKVYQIVDGQPVLKSTVSALTVTFTNQPSGTYTYKVYSTSTKFGDSAEGSEAAVTVEVPVIQPPANLIQTAKSATDFVLSWDAAANANSYKVYQIVNGQRTLKNTVSATNVTFYNQSPGEYTFEVASYSNRFGESAQATRLTFTLNGETMAAPTGLTQTITSGNDLTLKWTAAPYANSYKVYQIIDGQKVLKSTVTGTTVYYSNLPAGEYSYAVHSVSNTLGESPSGAEITVPIVFPVMAAPANLAVKLQNGNDAVLSWTGATYANSYKVYELVNGEKVLKTTVTSLTTTFSKLANGDHTYVVHSVSTRFGESPEGSQVSVSVNEQTMLPPTNLTYSLSSGNDVTLRWTASTYATSYKVYQMKGAEKVFVKTVTTTSAVMANQPEADYTYVVHSVSDRFGESPEGSTVTFPLVFPVMQAPANFRYAISSGNDIVLSWNSVTYATAYRVYAIQGGQRVLKKTVTGGGLSAVESNMPEGSYEYEVVSYSDRFGESPAASKVTFTLVWPVVQPPVLKGSVFNANNMTFTWNSVTWANEYRLYEVTGGTRQLLYKGTALTYKVYNLTETTHHYEVTAVSTRFGESAPSARWSENIIYPEMQPPTASLKLTDSKTAQILWTFATYANGYNVYQIVDGQPVALTKNLNNLSYTVTNLPYANHEFYVTSYSNSFGESAPSNVVTARLVTDTAAPVTSSDASGAWTSGSPVVTLTATDTDSGVAATYYAMDGGEYQTGTAVTFNEEGEHTLAFYSVDQAGNKEEPRTAMVRIDRTAPVTASQVSPEGVVTLTAADAASGVAATFYSVDGAPYTQGTSVEISADGSHQVSFYTVDAAGNKETAQSIEVVMDRTAPVTEAAAPEGWTAGEVTVTLAAADTGSGVAGTFYSIGGGAYTEGTSAVISSEGTTEVSFYSVDKAGNKEQARSVKVLIDRTAPVTTALSEDGKVSFTAVDPASGTAKTFYSVDGAAYVEGTSVQVAEEGKHSVSFYSVDLTGNEEKAQTVEVVIDRTAPVTKADAPSGWSAGEAAVTLTAEDALSGVAGTYYSVDGAPFVQGTSLVIGTDGIHEIVFYSVDGKGNKEEANKVSVQVDRTAPVTEASVPAGWSKEDVTAAFTATDAGSGAAQTFYSVNGAPYAEGTAVKVTAEGANTIAFYSKDAAGNVEAAKSITVNIDRTAPVVAMDLKEVATLGDTVTLSYTAKDSQSGIASETMTVTAPNAAEGTVVANGTALKLSQPGTYTVTVTAVDAAGLMTTLTKKVSVAVPATIEVTPGIIKGNNGVFTVRVSLPSGYSTQGFDLNTARVNGVKALTSNNGYYNQAKNGQFKFERSDFTWTGSEVTLVFQGYVNGILVIGQTTVKVQK
ncbi:OmpL47-type beta-barrel domain-containing protein [Paenibacillus sp. S-38]|uniref:OmpL47-type beta-barrel domain-containing protein n=1 Tax=Paenibacillus sp. S-38 TaxID=3416710 RepID=UPI003CF21FFF